MPEDSNISSQPYFTTSNHILKNLTVEDFERLKPYLKPVKLQIGQYLYNAEDTINHIYFPNNAMISVVANTSSGQSAEIGVIGFEVIVGVEALTGSRITLHDNLVQHADGALRIDTKIIKEEFKRGGALQEFDIELYATADAANRSNGFVQPPAYG